MVPNVLRRLVLAAALLPLCPVLAVTPGDETNDIPRGVNIGGGVSDYASAVAVQRDGKILLAGATSVEGRAQLAVARILPDGTPDAGFAGTGQRRIGFGPDSDSYAGWIGELPDGRILVVGTVIDASVPSASIVVMRLLANGEFDASFSIDGRARFGDDINAFCGYPLGVESFVGGCEVEPLPDGNLLISGTASAPPSGLRGLGPTGPILFYRIRPDATPDPTFGPDGRRIFSTLPTYPDMAFGGFVHGMQVRDNGRILLATSAYPLSSGSPDLPGIGLVQLLPNGTPDTSFGTGGARVIAADPGDGFLPHTVRLARDGRIYVGVFAQLSGVRAFAVARFLANGAPDPGFGSGGVTGTVFDLSGTLDSYDLSTNLHVDGSGRAYVIGHVTMPPINGQENVDMAVARFTPQGQPDASFGVGGRRTYGFDRDFGMGIQVLRERANDATVDGQGRIVIAGAGDRAGDDDFMMVRTIYTDDVFRDTFDGERLPAR